MEQITKSPKITIFEPQTHCSVYVRHDESCVLTAVKALGFSADGKLISSSFKVHRIKVNRRIARDYIAGEVLQHLDSLMKQREDAEKPQREISGIYFNTSWYKNCLLNAVDDRRKTLPPATQPAFTRRSNCFRCKELDQTAIEYGQLMFFERLEKRCFHGLQPDLVESLRNYTFDQIKGIGGLPVGLGAILMLMKNVGDDRGRVAPNPLSFDDIQEGPSLSDLADEWGR